MVAAGGIGEAGFVLDGEAGEFPEDGLGEEAGAAAGGAFARGTGEAPGVAGGAGGGAALEDEAVGGREGVQESGRKSPHFLREAAAGGWLDEPQSIGTCRDQPDRLARRAEPDFFFRTNRDDLHVGRELADEPEGDDLAVVAAGREFQALARYDHGPGELLHVLPLRVVVESAACLTPQPVGRNHPAEERRGYEAGLTQLFGHGVCNELLDVDPDEIQ